MYLCINTLIEKRASVNYLINIFLSSGCQQIGVQQLVWRAGKHLTIFFWSCWVLLYSNSFWNSNSCGLKSMPQNVGGERREGYGWLCPECCFGEVCTSIWGFVQWQIRGNLSRLYLYPEGLWYCWSWGCLISIKSVKAFTFVQSRSVQFSPCALQETTIPNVFCRL